MDAPPPTPIAAPTPVPEPSVPCWQFEYDVTYATGYRHTLKYGPDCQSCAKVWTDADYYGMPEKITKRIIVGGRVMTELDFPRDHPRLPTAEEAAAYLDRIWNIRRTE